MISSNLKNKEPLFYLDFREILNTSDIYTISIYTIYTIFAIVFYFKIPTANTLIYTNLLVIVFILTIAAVDTKIQLGRIFTIIRRLSIIPLVIIVYDQIQNYIIVINPQLYDNLLIKWDFALFGVNPTQWLKHISFPALTEYLQVCYFLYFFLPMAVGVELHIRNDSKKFDEFARIMLFSYFSSYLLYLFLPAIGPRFTLHNFLTIESDLPGYGLTHLIRQFLNVGSQIPHNVPNPELYVNKDCMPSGHTWITLLNIIYAFKYKSKFKWFILILGTSLVFSTIYLRYHYVVDILAGVILALLTLKIEPLLHNYLVKIGIVKKIKELRN